MPTLPREHCWLKCQERINTQKRLPLTPQAGFKQTLRKKQASLVAQLVKNLPAMWETRVQTLGWEDPLEKGRATHSTILAWRIPWTV